MVNLNSLDLMVDREGVLYRVGRRPGDVREVRPGPGSANSGAQPAQRAHTAQNEPEAPEIPIRPVPLHCDRLSRWRVRTPVAHDATAALYAMEPAGGGR
jgi:hypothetical protein